MARGILARISHFESIGHRRAILFNGNASRFASVNPTNRTNIDGRNPAPYRRGLRAASARTATGPNSIAPAWNGGANNAVANPNVQPTPRPDPNIAPKFNASNQGNSAEMVAVPEARPVVDPDASRFDAVGTLKHAASRRRDAPRYALVNASGKIASFVTPSPGVNLEPWVGKRVGVYGTRGYMPEFRLNHVTAARVMRLNESSSQF